MEHIITQAQIEAYCAALRSDERSAGTVAKYRRDVTAFAEWLAGRAATKETAAGWKAHLLEHHYAPRTVNSMLAAVNGFFKFAGWDIRVKFLKVQRQLFRDTARELTRAEYDRLLTAAQSSGQERPSAPPGYGSASCVTSPSRRRRPDVPPFPSRERSARFYSVQSCAASC